MTGSAAPRRIPLSLKLLYTAFMAVLIPVYLYHYGPTNFLYYCDVAAVMTLLALWLESPLLAAAALIGIFLPQLLWQIDFFAEAVGLHLTGLTGYMFDARRPIYLRFLSFFHFWLPFLLIYIVWRLGYDRRGLLVWTLLAWLLMPVCYFLMPLPGYYFDRKELPVLGATTVGLLATGPREGPAVTASALLAARLDVNMPRNINSVRGFSDYQEQAFLHPHLYFALMMVILPLGILLPTHLLFRWLLQPRHRATQITKEPAALAGGEPPSAAGFRPRESDHYFLSLGAGAGGAGGAGRVKSMLNQSLDRT